MTQEEKARAYDEALERARQFSEHPLLEDSGAIVEYIFPELAESEDERIKKDLIGFFKDEEFLYHKKEEIVEWLEKQGEKPQGKTALEAINEEIVDNANKVEPKFRVGDWITDGEAVFHITSYSIDYGYQLETPKGTLFHFSNENVENKYHLWTIQDAKDGDVLQLGGVTAIFREYIGYENCECYCSVCNGEFEIPSQEGNDNIYGCYNATPATKEQRNLLFSKMKEAGYEFDAEKKELKIKLKEPDGYDDNIKWSDTDKLLMRLDKIVDCNIYQTKCLNNIFDKLNEIS